LSNRQPPTQMSTKSQSGKAKMRRSRSVSTKTPAAARKTPPLSPSPVAEPLQRAASSPEPSPSLSENAVPSRPRPRSTLQKNLGTPGRAAARAARRRSASKQQQPTSSAALTRSRRTRSNDVAKQLFSRSSSSTSSSERSDSGDSSTSAISQLRKDLRQAEKEEESRLESTFTCPASLQLKRAAKRLESSGTVANRRVFIAVSDVCEFPIFGLFANAAFKKGDVVTTYGGRLRSAADARKEAKSEITHVRRIPGSLFVRDGKEFSSYFKRDSDSEMREDRKLPASARVHREITGTVVQNVFCLCVVVHVKGCG
jgi:hypothetical protein